MASSERHRLFRGEEVNLNQLEQTNVIRIFVSSTFSDMSVERNLLLEKAYPALRTFCQQIGLDFQVMDMRWGIQDAANVDHSTCDLCLREIKTCRRLSMGPYFVAFIGNRYGYRPIPSTIESEIFEKFLAVAKSHGIENSGLVEEWYKRDDNAVPACYVLQTITSKYRWFDDEDPENEYKRKADRESWADVSVGLSDALRKYAKLAMETHDLREAKGKDFFKSVTEMEIEEGLTREHSAGSVYLYRREITDIIEHVQEAAALKYVDLKEIGKVDVEAQELLHELKDGIDRLAGSSGNIKTYQVEWSSDHGISEKSQSHLNYLRKFCDDFVSDMKTSITQIVRNNQDKQDSELNQSEPLQESDWMFEEVAHHASFARKKCESFCGRKVLIGKVMQQLHSEGSCQPITVHGTSGKGKTALLAMLVNCCRKRAPDDVLIYRFLGTSPNSSHIHNVLQTLILQITEAYQMPIPELHLLQNFNEVVQRFAKLLADVSRLLQNQTDSSKHNLVIILDSLDQLSPLDGAHRLNWLPKQLPGRVRILLSTLPDPKLGIMKNLSRSLPGECFFEVSDLDEETGKEIIETWLAKDGRAVTKAQYELIMEGFRSSPQPLFLKLAFDEARRWHSYTDIRSLKMADSARGAISLFFDRLEKNHGKLFVSRAIGYLVAAKNGVTEAELEDLLSLDNDVLNDSYRYWSPPTTTVVRVPPLLWTRLRFDLGGDLVERQAVGHTVIALYHRQFIEVARERYLQADVRPLIHSAMADYFLGTWSDGKKKPLQLRIWKNKLYNSDRKAASQPFKFSERVFNFRKLDELPYHLLHAGMWRQLCDVVLSNATWMMNKIKAFAIKDVLDDFNMVLDVKEDPEIILIRDALKLAKPTLEFPGGIRNHLCTELYGRLAYFKSDFPNLIGKLVDESSRTLEKTSEPNLLPLSGCFQPPGGPLRTTLTGFSKPVTCLATSEFSSILVAGSREGLLMTWEIGSDDVIHTVKAHSDEVTCLAVAGTRLASGSLDNTLFVMNLDTGSRVVVIQEDHSDYVRHASLALSKEGTTLFSASGAKINVWDIPTLHCKFTLQNEERNPLSCNALLVDDAMAVAGYKDGSIVCWSAMEGKEIYRKQIEESHDDVIDNDVIGNYVRGERLFTLRRNGGATIFDVNTGKLIGNLHVEGAGACDVSPDGEILAVGVGNSVNLWRFTQQRTKHFASLRHHRDVITTIAFNSTGRTLVVGSQDEGITVWSIGVESTGDLMRPTDVIKGMGASIDHLVLVGDVVASASSQVFYIKLWNSKRNSIVNDPVTFPFNLKNHVITSCGRYLAITDDGTGDVTLHDLHSNRFERSATVSLQDAEVLSTLCFPNHSDFLLCGTNSGKVVKLWNSLLKKKQPSSSADLRSPEGNGCVIAMTTSADGRRMVAVTRAEDDEFLHFVSCKAMSVDHATSADNLSIQGKITALCLSDEVSGRSTAFVGTDECLIYVVRLEQRQDGTGIVGSCLEATLSEHDSPLTALALSPEQDHLFSGSVGKTRRLWKLQEDEWRLFQEISFSSLLLEIGATSAAFTRDGKYVISGSHDRSLKIWEVATGALVAAQYVYATVTGLRVTNDDRIIATTKMGYVIANKFYPGINKGRKERKSMTFRKKSGKTSDGGKSRDNDASHSTACKIF